MPQHRATKPQSSTKPQQSNTKPGQDATKPQQSAPQRDDSKPPFLASALPSPSQPKSNWLVNNKWRCLDRHRRIDDLRVDLQVVEALERTVAAGDTVDPKSMELLASKEAVVGELLRLQFR